MKLIYKIVIISVAGISIGFALVTFFTKETTKTIHAEINLNKVTNIDWKDLQSLDLKSGDIPLDLKK